MKKTRSKKSRDTVPLNIGASPLLAHVDKASICHTERRKTQRGERELLLLLCQLIVLQIEGGATAKNGVEFVIFFLFFVFPCLGLNQLWQCYHVRYVPRRPMIYPGKIVRFTETVFCKFLVADNNAPYVPTGCLDEIRIYLASGRRAIQPLSYTVRKMGFILCSIERMLKMQFSMARKFTLQPLRGMT